MITLLFFMIIAITITTAAVIIIASRSLATSKFEEGEIAKTYAESGVENAILRLIRNPGYTGETLTISDGSAEISVTGTNPKVINVIGKSHNIFRTLQIQAAYNNNVLTVTSWKELF